MFSDLMFLICMAVSAPFCNNRPDTQIALELAELSQLAYTLNTSESMLINNYTLEWYDDTGAFIAKKILDDETTRSVLVYRGTRVDVEDDINGTIFDVCRGVESTQTPIYIESADVYVAPGYFKDVTQEQLDAFKTVNASSKYITGHSKGGADAEIASVLLCSENCTEPAITYTFGAPPGVTSVNNTMMYQNLSIFEYVIDKDCVPVLWQDRKAIGTEYLLVTETSTRRQGLELLDIGNLLSLTLCKTPLGNITVPADLSQCLETHPIQNYINMLKDLLSWTSSEQ